MTSSSSSRRRRDEKLHAIHPSSLAFVGREFQPTRNEIWKRISLKIEVQWCNVCEPLAKSVHVVVVAVVVVVAQTTEKESELAERIFVVSASKEAAIHRDVTASLTCVILRKCWTTIRQIDGESRQPSGST